MKRSESKRRSKLCSTCHRDIEVRKIYYPVRSKFAVEGPSRNNLKPCRPTQHLPGTPEYLAVLRQRVLDGEELWHEQDARHEK